MPVTTPPQPTPRGPLRTLREPPPALRYGAALVGSAAALGLSLLFRDFVAPNVFIFFFAAIIVTAWYGGRGPALLVTALALPLVNWFFLTPRFSWAATPASVARLALFASLALLIGSMRESLAEARRRAETVAAEAEEQGVGSLRIELRASGEDDPGGHPTDRTADQPPPHRFLHRAGLVAHHVTTSWPLVADNRRPSWRTARLGG